ncbi:hypothetical protein VIGAN_02175100, partial [Vigna angularis var. angularis]
EKLGLARCCCFGKSLAQLMEVATEIKGWGIPQALVEFVVYKLLIKEYTYSRLSASSLCHLISQTCLAQSLK